MGKKLKEFIDERNQWRSKYPYLEALAPYQRHEMGRRLIYGAGSPEHLEACAALELAVEQIAEEELKSRNQG
jgi:hypothetical protein